MTSEEKERQAFSLRLRQSLDAAGIASNSPTELQRGFNKYHKGDKDVTMFAAYKWLRGESFPTQDKLRSLASWLGVSPVWLRYGETDNTKSSKEAKDLALTDSEIDLVKDFRKLSLGHREAVREMVKTLRRIEQKK